MKMDILGVDDTERRDKVGDDHEGEEDEDEEVEVGGQQGEDEAPKMRILHYEVDLKQWMILNGNNIADLYYPSIIWVNIQFFQIFHRSWLFGCESDSQASLAT